MLSNATVLGCRGRQVITDNGFWTDDTTGTATTLVTFQRGRGVVRTHGDDAIRN